MEELRVWIDSQTEEEIQRGIREAKPMSAYENLGKSGIMRTIEDYAMGINFSRVMSVKYGGLLNNAAGTRSYTAIAVGRVMTCVLGMVVIREREIRNFKETPFYRVVGNFTDAHVQGEWKAVEGSGYFASPLLYKENGFREKKDALALIDRVQGHPAIVESIEKNISRKRAPLLFNLAELQAECAKRFKISPDETLQVAQDLYERKLTTYPRTDARVLSARVAEVPIPEPLICSRSSSSSISCPAFSMASTMEPEVYRFGGEVFPSFTSYPSTEISSPFFS
jgi:DNA topoisomerase III